MSRWILYGAVLVLLTSVAFLVRRALLRRRRWPYSFLGLDELCELAGVTFRVAPEEIEVTRSSDFQTLYLHLPEQPKRQLALLFSQRVRGRLPPGVRVILVPKAANG